MQVETLAEAGSYEDALSLCAMCKVRIVCEVVLVMLENGLLAPKYATSIWSPSRQPDPCFLVLVLVVLFAACSGHVGARVGERVEHSRTLRVRSVFLGRLRGRGWPFPGGGDARRPRAVALPVSGSTRVCAARWKSSG